MVSLIIFNVGNNRYAFNIDNVQRIIHAKELTPIPNAHKFIDGMMSYEDGVVKVLNFRKMTGLEPHKEDFSDVEEFSQKFIIVERSGSYFAIKVDTIEDIVHVDETDIMSSDSEAEDNKYLELKGVLEIEGVLVNVIKTVSLPS